MEIKIHNKTPSIKGLAPTFLTVRYDSEVPIKNKVSVKAALDISTIIHCLWG